MIKKNHLYALLSVLYCFIHCYSGPTESVHPKLPEVKKNLESHLTELQKEREQIDKIKNPQKKAKKIQELRHTSKVYSTQIQELLSGSDSYNKPQLAWQDIQQLESIGKEFKDFSDQAEELTQDMRLKKSAQLELQKHLSGLTKDITSMMDDQRRLLTFSKQTAQEELNKLLTEDLKEALAIEDQAEQKKAFKRIKGTIARIKNLAAKDNLADMQGYATQIEAILNGTDAQQSYVDLNISFQNYRGGGTALEKNIRKARIAWVKDLITKDVGLENKELKFKVLRLHLEKIDSRFRDSAQEKLGVLSMDLPDVTGDVTPEQLQAKIKQAEDIKFDAALYGYQDLVKKAEEALSFLREKLSKALEEQKSQTPLVERKDSTVSISSSLEVNPANADDQQEVSSIKETIQSAFERAKKHVALGWYDYFKEDKEKASAIAADLASLYTDIGNHIKASTYNLESARLLKEKYLTVETIREKLEAALASFNKAKDGPKKNEQREKIKKEFVALYQKEITQAIEEAQFIKGIDGSKNEENVEKIVPITEKLNKLANNLKNMGYTKEQIKKVIDEFKFPQDIYIYRKTQGGTDASTKNIPLLRDFIRKQFKDHVELITEE